MLVRKKCLKICDHILEKYVKMFIFSKFAGSKAVSRKADLFNTFLWLLGVLFSVPASFTLLGLITDTYCKRVPRFTFVFCLGGVSSSNCPKFTKICTVLLIPHVCPTFLNYALIVSFFNSLAPSFYYMETKAQRCEGKIT